MTLNLNPDIEEGLLGQAREIAVGAAEPARERLIDVLMAAPFAGSELKIQRSRDYPRAVDL